MTIVRILKNWEKPDLMTLTPHCKGVWDDVVFTCEDIEKCDYAIVLNGVLNQSIVSCRPEHIWTIIQEPPSGFTKPWHKHSSYSYRTFTCDAGRSGPQYIHTHPALPWHVNRDYDYLTTCQIPQKSRKISWITSNAQVLEGHRMRMRFMQRIQQKLDYDLYGIGFQPIKDKWDGLAPYCYSLAIENFSNEYYWTEKIADCFLAWTMPIYYGCSRITEYFPEESLISIDIHSPYVIEQIQEAISEQRWRRNLEAIRYARELVLNKYQLFPFLVNHIRQFENQHESQSQSRQIVIFPRFEMDLSLYTLLNQPQTLQTKTLVFLLLIKLRVRLYVKQHCPVCLRGVSRFTYHLGRIIKRWLV